MAGSFNFYVNFGVDGLQREVLVVDVRGRTFESSCYYKVFLLPLYKIRTYLLKMVSESKSLPFENCLYNLCYPDEGIDGVNLSVQTEAKEIFLDGLRLLGSLLTSLPRKASAPIETTNRSLIIRGINDLLLAFHAICTGYYPQAQNLLRPVIESYNLIKLFKKDPKKIQPWLDGGESSKKELTVAKVREALYGNSQDPFQSLYSFLCEFGSHPRFAGSKSSVVLKNSPSQISEDAPTLVSFIGGKRLQPFHTNNLILCLFMLLPLYLIFSEVYPEIIQKAELDNLIKYLRKLFDFGKCHFPKITERSAFLEMLNGLDQLMQERGFPV